MITGVFLVVKQLATQKRTLSIKALGAFLVGFFYFPILSQKFWMLDDHTFVGWYDNKNSSIVQNFSNFLFETNFGDFGEGTRFTPTQDIFFVVRTLILPNDPFYWYVINFLIVIAVFFLATKILKDFFNSDDQIDSLLIEIANISLITLSLCNIVAAQVYGRLGIGESIAVLFLLLSLRTLQRLRVSPDSKLLWFKLLCYQGFLVGSKENYVWLIGAYIFWVMINVKSSKKYGFNVVPVYVLFSFAQMMIIILGVAPGILRSQKNVYGRPISPELIIDTLVIILRDNLTSLILIVSIFCIAILAFRKKNGSSILIAFAPILFLVFDQVFYQGIIVAHYQTNKVVAAVWTCAVVIKMVITEKLFRKTLSYVFPIILVIANFYYFQSGYNRIQEHKKATITFANGLDEIVNTRINYLQVAFVAQSAWDYETVFSTIKQLRGRGDVRPYFLLIAKEFEFSNDPNLPIFREWSINGISEDLYSPISLLNSNKQIICYYSEFAPILEKQCDENIIIKWLP